MTYNETAETWYDSDNKEDLTFLNFDHSDESLYLIRNYYTYYTKGDHAVMNYDGEWRSRGRFFHYSPYVLCELT